MKRLHWAVMVILQLNRIIRHYLQQALRFRVQNLQQHSSMISMIISRFRGKQQKFKFKYLTLALELGAGLAVHITKMSIFSIPSNKKNLFNINFMLHL